MIEKEKLIKYCYYIGTCRNSKIAQWNGEEFIFINYNFTNPYIESIKYFGDVVNDTCDGFIPIKLINIDYDEIKKEKIIYDYNNYSRKIYLNILFNDLPNEVWKDIKGYDNYLVSNLGRIKNIKHGFIMKQNFCRDYLVLGLTNNNGERKTIRVHRIVAEAFCTLPNLDKYEVNHINGVKTDNRSINLEYVSHKNNSEKNFTSGNYSIKLTPKKVKEILDLLHTRTMKQKDIAKLYNVSPSIISEIKTNKKWVNIITN